MYQKEVQLAISLFEAIDDVNLSNIIILLEKYNADPNVIIPKLQIAPIHFAVGFEDVAFSEKVTELFLKKKGDPNIFTECDSKLTPLHIACIYGRTNIVKMLLNYNGDVNLECNEGHTPIIYALQENHYDVISVIKNHIFELKIERKKKELAARTQENAKIEMPKTPKNEYSQEGTPVKNALTAIQHIDQKKFTPNRINYNFDVTSPYYINITHRRHKTSRTYDESIDKTENETEKRNLFELTEENVKAFSKLMHNPIVIDRIAIHKRKSYIDTWRHKIQQIQKDDYSYINYLNACNDVTLLSKHSESTSDVTCKDFEVLSSSDSFITANSDLQRNGNAIKHVTTDYIETYEEDYIHSDHENGMVLYEKKIISRSRENLNKMKECAISDSSLSTVVTLPPLDYDTDTLRQELKSFGHNTGPITKTTKKLYLKKLVKIKKYPNRFGINQENNSVKISYSLELQRTLSNYDYLEQNLTDFLKLEERMVRHFSEKNHLRIWREGNSKTSFIYLLLDPRVTNNMSIHQKQLSKAEIWEKFLKAIFYVGKGKNSRPYSHLYDALKVYSQNPDVQVIDDFDNNIQNLGRLNKMSESKKLKKIIEIWNENHGVVCLHVFHNIIPSEAYSREAAIIETIGINNLTNLKKGDYYGAATAYTMREKRLMGIGLLYRALHVYLAEGESQMKPNDF